MHDMRMIDRLQNPQLTLKGLNNGHIGKDAARNNFAYVIKAVPGSDKGDHGIRTFTHDILKNIGLDGAGDFELKFPGKDRSVESGHRLKIFNLNGCRRAVGFARSGRMANMEKGKMEMK
jgi:hypothetical protein